jgi:hypothetical protein
MIRPTPLSSARRSAFSCSCLFCARPSASSPSHDVQDQGSFPAASHSLSRTFASATDPRALAASAKASHSQTQTIVLGVLSALAMAYPVALGQDRPGVAALGRLAKDTAGRVRSAIPSRSQAARRPPRCSSRVTNAARRVAARRDKPTNCRCRPHPPYAPGMCQDCLNAAARRAVRAVMQPPTGAIAAPLAAILTSSRR